MRDRRRWIILLITVISGLNKAVNYAAGADADATCPDVAQAASLSLRSTLFCNYDPLERPVKDRTVATNVTFFLSISSVDFEGFELSIYGQTLTEWKDEFLQWNISDYAGQRTIEVSSSDVWVPDVELFTSSDLGDSRSRLDNLLCYVNYTGNVHCNTVGYTKARCSPDLARWPFDKQNCTLRFGSWTYSAVELNLTIDTVDNGTEWYYAPHMNWDLVSSGGELQVLNIVNTTHHTLIYFFLIQRHARGHVATVIVPALVLTLMTLIIFCLEPDSAERLCLICLNILCHCIFLQYLGINMPRNGSNAPLIAIFFRDSLIMTAVSLVISVLVKNMHGASSSPPSWAASLASGVLATRPGQFLLCSIGGNHKERMRSEEDDSLDASSGWRLLAVLLDRITFFTFFITFIALLSALLP